MCHEEIGEHAEQAAVPHVALEVARCADCHNPHASPQANLVRRPDGATCTECHEDQAPGEGEVRHAVIEQLGCEACHEAHGGQKPKLLREEGDALCLHCHGEGALEAPAGVTSVVVLDRFEVPAEQAAMVPIVRLSSDGERGHPLPKHRVRGTPTERELKNAESTFEGEMSCLTCHDPHKGRSSQILRWGAESGTAACQHCHKK
ncbi:MAG: cytochrome c3 family protein [Planctomycetota bacterium]|jgi:predicted CXXCH cytochrome family protein